MKPFDRLVISLLFLGAIPVNSESASAGTVLDRTMWTADAKCTIDGVEFLDGDQSTAPEAMVFYKNSQDENDAMWTLSGNNLNLSNFIQFPADTFAAKFDGVRMTATHTWEEGTAAVHSQHSETCTLTKDG